MSLLSCALTLTLCTLTLTYNCLALSHSLGATVSLLLNHKGRNNLTFFHDPIVSLVPACHTQRFTVSVDTWETPIVISKCEAIRACGYSVAWENCTVSSVTMTTIAEWRPRGLQGPPDIHACSSKSLSHWEKSLCLADSLKLEGLRW